MMPAVTLIRSISRSAALAALFLFVGCASQAPPSGGPPDRTSPFVVSTMPKDGAVGVSQDTPIEVLFSEDMDRRSLDRAVFVSPRPWDEPELNWKGKKLRIETGALSPDRTYRVSIGSAGRDTYRNKMITSHDFTFSTGATIHNGEIGGRLRDDTGLGALVVAFDLSESFALDARAPYETQPGADGAFVFPGLRPGRYRVLAFTDLDKDQVLDLGIEPAAIPPEDVMLTIDRPYVRLRDLRMAHRDMIPPRPVVARTVDSRRIRLKMNEPVSLPLRVEVQGDLYVRSAYHDPSDSSVVYLQTSPQIEGATYRLTVLEAMDAQGVTASSDTVLILKGDGRLDTRAPALVDVDPAETVTSDAAIVLTFDEGMSQEAIELLWLTGDSLSSPAGKAVWVRPNILAFTATEGLGEGRLKFLLNHEAFTDVAGNRMEKAKDFTINVVSDRDLGVMMGEVHKSGTSIVIQAARKDGYVVSEVTATGEDTSYVFSDMVPGTYYLSGFADTDGDGKWFAGSLAPYRPSEPILDQVDTVEVRARWEAVSEVRFGVRSSHQEGAKVEE